MSFNEHIETDSALPAGVVLSGHLSNIDYFSEFEDSLIIGRYNTVDTATGKLKPIADGLKIHGVTHRILTGDMAITEFRNDNVSYVESCDVGYTTATLVNGDAPVKGQQAYANITTGDDLGKATTTVTTVLGGKFWRQESANVWLIKLNIGGQ